MLQDDIGGEMNKFRRSEWILVLQLAVIAAWTIIGLIIFNK